MKKAKTCIPSKNTCYVLYSLTFIVCLILLVSFCVIQASSIGTVINSTTIPEGVYQLRNAYTGKYMQVQGVTNGSKVIQSTGSNSNNQKFIVRSSGIDNNQYYILLANYPQMSLDINSGSDGNIQLEVFRHLYYTPLSYSNQRFLIEKVGSNNYYSIKTNCGTNNCITVNTATNAVMQNTFSSSTLNYWYFERCGDVANIQTGYYQIKNTYSGKYMEVQDGDTENGSKIVQGEKSTEDCQLFYIESLGNNQYYIQPLHILSKSLDIPNWYQGNVQVEIYDHLATDDPSNQTFRIESVDAADNYSIKPLHTVGNPDYGFSNSCLTVNTSTNAVMQDVYASSSSLNHWKLEKVELLEDGVYSLQSIAYPSLFAGVPGCSPDNGEILGQFEYDSNPDTTDDTESEGDDKAIEGEAEVRAGLFKFVRQRGTLYHIIPMANNKNSLFPDISKAQVVSKFYGGGYEWNVTVHPDQNISISTSASINNYYIHANSSGQKEDNLVLSTSNNTATAKWGYTKCTENLLGVTVLTPGCHIVDMGTTGFDLSVLGDNTSFWSSDPTQNDAGTVLYYSVKDVLGSQTTVATVDFDGIVNCVSGKVGVVKVTAHYSSGATASTNIYVKPPSTGREFFILQSVQVVGNKRHCIEPSSTGVVASEFDFDDAQIWEWIHYSGDWYRIRNVSTGRYLMSPTNTAEGSTLSTTASTSVSDRTLWKKLTSSNDSRRIILQSKYMYDNAPALRVVVENNVLKQRSASSASATEDFSYIKLGEDAVYNRNITWPTSIDPSKFMFELAGHYDSFMLIHSDIYLDLSMAEELLESSKIIIFDGHGGATGMAIHERPQEYIHNIDIYDPENPENSLDLSGVDIVFFNGCSTAGSACPECDSESKARGIISGYCTHSDDPIFNMPKSAELAGAKVAIGWSEVLYDNHANDWIDRFLMIMNQINDETMQKYTAEEACEYVNFIVTQGNANTAVCYGTNTDFRFQ